MAALAVLSAGTGAMAVAGILLLVMVGLLIDARRWLRRAGRSRVGACSEDEVRRALAPLEAEGWRLRHSLPYRGGGDIDSVAIAPTDIAFAIDVSVDRLVPSLRAAARTSHRPAFLAADTATRT